MSRFILAVPFLAAGLPATAQSFEVIGAEVGVGGVYWAPSGYAYGQLSTGLEVGFGGPVFLSLHNVSIYDGTDVYSNTTGHLGYQVSPSVSLGVFGAIELNSLNLAYWVAGAEVAYDAGRFDVAGYAGYTAQFGLPAANSFFFGADASYEVNDRLAVKARAVTFPAGSFVQGGIGLDYKIADNFTAGAGYDLSYNSFLGVVDHTISLTLTYTFGEGTRFGARDYISLAKNY